MSVRETGVFLGRIPFVHGGSGDKTAVVFFGANALFQRLGRRRPEEYGRMVEAVLPPDYRYWILGYDANPPPDFGFGHIVSDFAAIVRSQTGPTTILGVSFGGFVAQRFAAEHPALVERLVLLISAHRFSIAGWRKVLRQEAYMRRGDLYAFVKDMALLFRRPWYNWMVHAALWQGRHTLARRINDPAMLLRVYESLFGNFDNAPYARRIQAPTLVVGGTRDQFFDVEAFEETAQLIPDTRLELLRGETHMVPLERARDVRSILTEFLDRAP